VISLDNIPPNGFIQGTKFQGREVTSIADLLTEEERKKYFKKLKINLKRRPINKQGLIKPKLNKATDIFYEVYFTDFKTPYARHNRRMKDSKIVYTRKEVEESKEFKELGIVKPIEKIEYGQCYDEFIFKRPCNHAVSSSDNGITVCEGCGTVLGYVNLDIGNQIQGDKSNYPDVNYCKTHEKKEDELSDFGKHITDIMEDKSYYKRLTEKEPSIDDKGNIKYKDNSMKNWRKSQKYFHVGTVSTKYMMTPNQRREAKEIIKKYPLIKLHSRINEKAIILGICIYVMKKQGRHILINKSPYCEELGLSKHNYEVIKRNLDRLLK